MVELLVEGDVNKLIDRCGNHRAAKAAIVGRQIAAPANEAHPQRCATDNHFSRELLLVTITSTSAKRNTVAPGEPQLANQQGARLFEPERKSPPPAISGRCEFDRAALAGPFALGFVQDLFAEAQ